MNDQRIQDELLALLEGAGVKLRREPMGGTGGGLCMMKGQRIFFIDTEANSAETAARCAGVVGTILDVETVYIRPEVRQYIEEHAGAAQ